jgi:lipoyl(octanoyl) transferase
MWILQVEHQPPVVTVTRRPGVAEHLLVDEARLNTLGIELAETDRGGDITYHGPGQLVLYPILDLNRLGLRIHPYLRLLEEAVIRTLAEYGIRGERDPTATGVWVPGSGPEEPARKICAMGVRLSRWCSMHGLALNVDPDLEHFQLIVPCGLARPVTSLRRELGSAAPHLDDVREQLTAQLLTLLHAQGLQK